MAHAAGAVLSLHRWPVKSMGGEAADALELTAEGARGDRAVAVMGQHKGSPRRLNASFVPRLLAWSAASDPADPARPQVTAPDGTRYAADDPALVPALAADLGREVELRGRAGGEQDIAGTVLLTVESG